MADIITCILILLGAVVMCASIYATVKVIWILNKRAEQRRWGVLLGFMVIFLLGYLATLFFVLRQVSILLPLFTGIIFFLGALFVYLIVRVSKITMQNLIKTTASVTEAQEELKNKNREILEFTDVMIHDLKKPLATMKTVNTLMENETMCKLTDDGRGAVGMGKKAIHYMHELLDDLLTCARLESGTHKLEKEDINIGEIVQKVLYQLKYQIEEKKIKVKTDSIDICLEADRKALNKIFMNLLGNAVGYIGNGPEPKVSIGCSRENSEYKFYVEDNGLGIPEDAKKNIFQKFKRGGNVTGISGTGLGLAIVKASVEAHNGEIWLESKEGKGSTFYFTLPKNG